MQKLFKHLYKAQFKHRSSVWVLGFYSEYINQTTEQKYCYNKCTKMCQFQGSSFPHFVTTASSLSKVRADGPKGPSAILFDIIFIYIYHITRHAGSSKQILYSNVIGEKNYGSH